MAGAFSSAFSSAFDTVATTGGGGGGWDTLLGIIRADRQERAARDALPPEACPLHGNILQTARGVLHCAMGHIVSPDDRPR